MKVKEYFKELSDVLNAYTFGDLFEAMQAVELCDQFITENEIPEEELAQIRLLKSLLESIILQGSSDEQEAELLRIKTALLEGTAAEAAPAHTHAVPAAAEEPQAPSVTADELLAQMGGAEPEPEDSGFARLLSQMNGAADGETQQQDIDSLLSQMQPPQDEAPAPEAESAVQKQETPAGPKPGEMLTITVDDGETLNSFVAESTEHLDNVENLIVNLEATHDRDTVNAIFRAMHTIKGISGFMGFSQITQLSHRLENLLDALRSNAIDFSSELIDILLSGSDILRSMMNVLAPVAVRYAASEDSFAVEFPVYDLSSILNDIERYMAAHECGAENSTPSEPAKNEEIPQPQPAAEPAFSSPMLTARELGEYAYAAKKVFENLKRSLTILQQDIRNETAMREIVTEIKALHDASLKTGVHEIIDLCELITNKINRVSDGYTLSYSDLFSSLKTLADAFKARMALLKQAAGEELPPIGEEENGEAGGETAPISPVQPQPFQMPTAEPQTERPQPETVQPSAPAELPKAKEGDAPQKTVSASAAVTDPEATTVRVDIKKMDRLFNMIGELITAQDILMGQFDEEDESQEIQKAKNNLENVTREIQELSMQLRMITLNGLFNKMKRLVRDLSRKLQKEINFTIFGQDTEMDRNVIDEISDPLMHIIRNALDHGIETPAERTASGKPITGNVTLGAKYEGNSIVISVRDDGRGLDKAKIKEKAIRKGIITAEEAANLPERKIFDLIMLPGFSTSETVSDISGRGVGMDVVKRSIDALRGSVIIRSEEGKGSEFLIRIPLTLAIIDAITFKLGDLTFATQITDVVEFYKFREEQVTVTQSQGEVLNLRGELIPILEMSRCYGTDHHYQRYEDGIAIIAVSSNDKKVAVVVDEIIGNKNLVIKPLPQMFAHLSSLSGCSILAGGETCLIVDMNRLLGETLDLV